MRPADDGRSARPGDAGRHVFAAGLAASIGLHAVAAWLLTVTHARLPDSGPSPEMRVVIHESPLPETPPAVEIPPSGTPIARPPIPADEPDARGSRSPEPPVYVPYDVAPRLMNAADVVDRLVAGYPAGLSASPGRPVLLWLHIDEGGRVGEIRIQRSSGSTELDELARRIAPGMAFRPALYRGKRVAVWVAQVVRFGR